MSSEIVDNALLLATLPDLTAPHFLVPVITHAVQYTRKRLTIVLFSRYFNVCPQAAEIRRSGRPSPTFAQKQGLSHTLSWDAVQRILTFTYVQATKIAWEMNKVLMEVDVLLKGFNEDLTEDIGTGVDIVFRVNGDTIAAPFPQSIFTLREMYLEPGDQVPDFHTDTTSGVPEHSATMLPSCYPVTALGGTFDHLHAGHKILLSMGAYITSQKLIVGVTDDALLQNKSNKHVLEKLATRIQRVRDFLTFFKPEIIPEIVPITDVYGPTGWDPNIQALVVSKETLSGGDAIARHRAANNLPPLQPFLIDVISATQTSLDHDDVELLKTHKLSSTYVRQWIVDHSKQEEEEEEDVNVPVTEN
ncbi:hypothetical protein HYPSUDRAFT_149909 [Hypholoma sublateritium FD-334 SS-4]|uniref:Cytidyltransferase-like domain-containing protein n=1 Tax=Hypholoma sublateritium (strain FD-334 SS-4) TaxID=945553 RepID=A0A0D2N6S9_HYPSF|nr:hypothetical protein HYPSUDRAFT_149909 [Hypholoma sublateritium FD-334 SS-4]